MTHSDTFQQAGKDVPWTLRGGTGMRRLRAALADFAQNTLPPLQYIFASPTQNTSVNYDWPEHFGRHNRCE
jgi:hypothetical protein